MADKKLFTPLSGTQRIFEAVLIAITLMAAVSEKLKYADMPHALRGLGSRFIMVGLRGLGFMSFSGVSL